MERCVDLGVRPDVARAELERILASPGVAARLAGQTTEDRVVLSWAELPDLCWL